ncbi:hypothetical protein SAMN05660649_04911 [Desulfotomaculum arcticum]|uniref:Uncharacterized protein n=1 Tax=Desulfotruncus arcticus DSM 17038 TaxID=1121424 RepID=A0A1I2ZEZ2_9FIRM|nr:hypothetical protein [Desulfotruncus arcticus]SFH36407.1 hypothetical protein SAMN05660649_04911 [Desulfotomaculum arcticum] [Desulfotruncus arcticus DSM 17038]
MRHQSFNKLDSVVEYGQADLFGVIPSAEEVTLNKLGKGSNVIEIRRQDNQPQKFTLSVKRIFPGPDSRYNSPFTQEEATQILINAGLEDVEVLGTFLSGWPGCEYHEPLGPSQVILIKQNNEKAELYLQYLKEEDIRKIIEGKKVNLYLKCSKIKPLWHVVGVRKIVLA